MKQTWKAGVVGAGVFGGFHARKYAALSDVELAAVFDPDAARAQALAGELGARAFTELDPFLGAAEDLVTIASPAFTHYAIASHALARGRHVYVEKPLATDIADARLLVQTARAEGLVLAVGHQERVVFRAMRLLDAPEAPLELNAVRRGTPSERNRDVSCVLDLMIHDIDLAIALDPSPVAAIEAEGTADEAGARITFESGGSAKFEASRIAERRERTMRVAFPSGELNIDFLTLDFANTTRFPLNPGFAGTAEGKDPLGTSVSEFVAAVRGGRDRPLVSGADTLRALDAALRIDRILTA
ncbi:MAG TPA: Gfo/Idh/MocA family oxidoreductase [Caulobacteraceae bacterium]|jgi:predicted dehydrogenase